jgi:hypothetical protein
LIRLTELREKEIRIVISQLVESSSGPDDQTRTPVLKIYQNPHPSGWSDYAAFKNFRSINVEAEARRKGFPIEELH